MAEIYRPIDVLDKQVELVRFWKSSQFRHGFAETFDFMINTYNATAGVPVDKFLADRLDTAETFYVRSNIISRLWDFTDVYEAHEHEVILPQDLPCPRGFIFLERAIHIIDANGQVVSIKAILWSEEHGGVSVSQFSDARDPLDEVNQDWRKRTGKKYNDEILAVTDLPLNHIMPWAWGKKINNLTVEDFSLDRTVGHLTKTDEELAKMHESMPSAVVSMNRFNQFLISLWEFVQEQIPFRMAADRPMMKRLKRAHSPLKEVTVVELRPTDRPPQITDPDHVPQQVLWTHQWRVREHKRRWIDKHGNYRETTVSAHIKGPDHLPLIEKDRVYHVRK